MAILVSDTATEILAVGIGRVEDGQLRVAYSSSAVVPRAHSKWLQPTLAHGMKVCKINPGDVDVIGVGVGPGSYTGVRLAVSTAKAMAYAWQVPLAPIPTLLTIAEAATCLEPNRPPSIVIPLLNARRQRAFGAVFEKQADGRWNTLEPVAVKSVNEWHAHWQHFDASSGYAASVKVVSDIPDLWADIDLPEPDAGVVSVGRVSALFPEAMMRLVADEQVHRLQGEDIHTVVPEYALLVEAESQLAERGRSGGHC